tara:strand:- start:1379 stop:1873 length:495 start_codon:yes stop_codon:yes gene_type:complete
MGKNTGKNFENEIRKSLKGADCWWFRIQDTNDVSKFVKQAIAEKQPADFMAVYRGNPILLECKTTRNLTSFPLYYGSSRSIPPHQVKMGLLCQRAGGISLILIRRDESRNKRAWAITPEQADYLYKKEDGKSIKWSWFEDNAIELIRLKNPVRWNLNKLFEEAI